MSLLALLIYRASLKPHRNGDLFKMFMAGYFVFRLLIDFIKPGGTAFGLGGIQWACVAMLLYYARDLVWIAGRRQPIQNDL